MDLLSESRDKRFFLCLFIFQLLSSKYSAEFIMFCMLYLLFLLDHRIILHIQQIENQTMKQMKEEDYNRKLTAIEGKFKIICERYQLITEEMKSKDQVIHKMTGEISELEMKLEMANATIARLEKQANKTDLLQKTYYLRHKAKLESNELIESESSSNQIKSRAHISKNGVRSQALNLKLSQESIGPEEQKIKISPSKDEDDNFDNVLTKIKAKIASKASISIVSPISKLNNPALAESLPRNSLMSRIKSVQNIKLSEPTDPRSIKTLQKILQQRDSELSKMDQLFESLNSKLKDYQQ